MEKPTKPAGKAFRQSKNMRTARFCGFITMSDPPSNKKNRPREFPKGGIAWCTLCTGGEGGISLIKDDPKISMSKMAEQTGYSAKQIEKTIDKLKARGIVSRSGADNGGVWIINE